MKKVLLLIVAALLLAGCGGEKKTKAQKPLYDLTSGKAVPKFSGENAYKYVEEQVAFGPRNPNSQGAKMALQYFKNFFEQNCDKFELQNFIYTGYQNEKLDLTNIIAKYKPEAKRRIILCAHWDTRPRAEQDKNEANKHKPILGANDGGSGTGVLMEIARILKENPVDYGVDIILFDGEDYGEASDLDNFCIGSKYFGATKDPSYQPVFAILLDLIGDIDAKYPQDPESMSKAPEVVNMVWRIAQDIGASRFISATGSGIYDDHVALNQNGIKAINIIDSDIVGADSDIERKNYWHTQNDTMENIDKEALQQVGDVLVKLIYSLKFNR
ncbi:MAG: M28 family peptidase [Rhodothermaceae bacterium]